MSDDSAEPMQWVFQYNPEWYDLEASVKRSLVEEWTMFSHRMIFHGRQVCFARKPNCAECALAPLCPKVGVKLS